MLYCDIIDISEGINVAKSNNSKESMIFTIGLLIMESNFKIMYAMFVIYLTMLSVNISNIAKKITVKKFNYRCIICNISKSEAINLLKNSVLEDHGYI